MGRAFSPFNPLTLLSSFLPLPLKFSLSFPLSLKVRNGVVGNNNGVMTGYSSAELRT